MDNRRGDAEAAGTRPPFVYEIRVKARLSPEPWTSWFDNLSVTFRNGESTLQGQVPDHAALYGLLARLRDLAIPLVSVKVLDAQAQRQLARERAHDNLLINVLLAGVYLALLGVLATITIFATRFVNTALALALLFAVLAGLAHAFWLRSGQQAWRWFGYLAWLAALICFAVFIPVSGLLPAPLGLGVLLVLIAGALLYAVAYLRRRAADIDALLPERRTLLDSPTGGEHETTDQPAEDEAELQAVEDGAPVRLSRQ